jgi:hypothetical protein
MMEPEMIQSPRPGRSRKTPWSKGCDLDIRNVEAVGSNPITPPKVLVKGARKWVPQNFIWSDVTYVTQSVRKAPMRATRVVVEVVVRLLHQDPVHRIARGANWNETKAPIGDHLVRREAARSGVFARSAKSPTAASLEQKCEARIDSRSGLRR